MARWMDPRIGAVPSSYSIPRYLILELGTAVCYVHIGVFTYISGVVWKIETCICVWVIFFLFFVLFRFLVSLTSLIIVVIVFLSSLPRPPPLPYGRHKNPKLQIPILTPPAGNQRRQKVAVAEKLPSSLAYLDTKVTRPSTLCFRLLLPAALLLCDLLCLLQVPSRTAASPP